MFGTIVGFLMIFYHLFCHMPESGVLHHEIIFQFFFSLKSLSHVRLPHPVWTETAKCHDDPSGPSSKGFDPSAPLPPAFFGERQNGSMASLASFAAPDEASHYLQMSFFWTMCDCFPIIPVCQRESTRKLDRNRSPPIVAASKLTSIDRV